jgi:hypothetical protein
MDLLTEKTSKKNTLFIQFFMGSSCIGKSTSFLSFLFCCIDQGASAVHFHDFNAEVLRCLTIPNVNANLLVRSHRSATKEGSAGNEGELRFFAGDWSQVHLCLPHVHEKEMDLSCSSGHGSCSQ